METYIPITYLNDFVFCPLSIYFHNLYGKVSDVLYYDTSQLDGRAAHSAIDEKRYSTHKNILQGIDVYSAQYGLCGKIDIYDGDRELLTERKKKIKMIYDGYIFQLYAQYFCMVEMGYSVKHLRFYSMDDNRVHSVNKPEDDRPMLHKFISLLDQIMTFDISSFMPDNTSKCANCIYSNLCDRPLSCVNQ